MLELYPRTYKFNANGFGILLDNSEICFQLFGEEKIDILNHHNEGDNILVSFNLSSREYNGKYFHNIDAWRIEKETTNNSEIESAPKFDPTESEDDLPF